MGPTNLVWYRIKTLAMVAISSTALMLGAPSAYAAPTVITAQKAIVPVKVASKLVADARSRHAICVATTTWFCHAKFTQRQESKRAASLQPFVPFLRQG